MGLYDAANVREAAEQDATDEYTVIIGDYKVCGIQCHSVKHHFSGFLS